MQSNTTIRYVVNMQATFQNLKEAVDKLRIVVPAKTEGGKPTIKEAIKGNVYSTAKEIYRLLFKESKKSVRQKVVALRTKNPSLARLCRNSCRTTQRHIDKLIHAGIIQGKARTSNGIQLLLSGALVVFSPQPVPDHKVVHRKAPTPATPSQLPQQLKDLASALAIDFSVKKALGST